MLSPAIVLCKHYDSFGLKETNKYCTRNTEITLKHKTAFFEKSVSYTGLKMFHSLPQEIKCLKDNKFKKKLKEYLATTVPYSISDIF